MQTVSVLLKSYTDNGYVDWNKLFQICNKNGLMNKPYPIRFKFGIRHTVFVLAMKNFEIKGNEIYAEEVKIEPYVPAIAESTVDGETPMWVDNEWYKIEGVIYRWLGRKSYQTQHPDFNINLVKSEITGEIKEIIEEEKAGLERFEPVKSSSGTEYVPYGSISK